MTLRKIVVEFRKGLLEDRQSKNWCYMVSAPLCGYLQFCGYECTLQEGKIGKYHHFWINLDGIIIDATADQFKKPDGTDMPAIYIGVKPEWYKLTLSAKMQGAKTVTSTITQGEDLIRQKRDERGKFVKRGK
jgi:hypothetical protein